MNVNNGLGQAIGNSGIGQAAGNNGLGQIQTAAATSGWITVDHKQHPCPSCGHCLSCGRGGWVAPRPWYGYPYFYAFNGDPRQNQSGGYAYTAAGAMGPQFK